MAGVQTLLGFGIDRTFSPRLAGDLALMMEGSGVVDQLAFFDQLHSWFPTSLWDPDVTPLALTQPDPHSFHDPFITATFAAANTTKVGLTITCDAIRRGPTELTQTMLSCAGATEGRSRFWIGAGELKQCKAYGHKRKEGLDRMEDLFRIFRRYLENDGPIDYDGHHWTLRHAWLGGAMPHTPKIIAMGQGPRLIELAAKYADGVAPIIPASFRTPEEFAAMVKDVKEQVERHGRDPEAFEINAGIAVMLHEDPEFIDQAFDNPLTQWYTAIFGRLEMAKWLEEGFEPPFPVGWHYALKLLPLEYTAEEVEAVLNRVTRGMVEQAFQSGGRPLTGTPKEVAATLDEFREAGATTIAAYDMAPTFMPFEEAMGAVSRSLEVMGILKGVA